MRPRRTATILEGMQRTRDDLLALGRQDSLDAWIKEATGRRVRDVLAHVAAWELEAARSLEAYAAGSVWKHEPFDVDGLNQTFFEQYRDWSDDQVRALLAQSHAALADATRSLSDDQVIGELVYPWGARGDVETLLLDMWNHEHHHKEQVRHVLDVSP